MYIPLSVYSIVDISFILLLRCVFKPVTYMIMKQGSSTTTINIVEMVTTKPQHDMHVF